MRWFYGPIRTLLFSLICSFSVLAHGPNSSSPLNAAPWSRVTEGTLSVYTQVNPAQASALLHSFAQLRNALAQASAFQVNQTANLRIIAFQTEKDFNQYRLNSGSCAFYQQTRRGEYVVLQDLDLQHREVSSHEFTHFVLAHSGLTLPLWLNEGLADFYSTFQVSGDHVTFGRSERGRLAILRSSGWLPFNALFDVSTHSSYYSDPERMALFYSESWGLAHMLLASPDYGARFPYFLRALNDGHTTAESFQLTYNKTVAQVQDDLREYVDRQHLPLIEAQLPTVYNAALPVSTQAISNAEMDIALADLTATNPNTLASVERRLATASNQLPGAEAEESLGYIALRQGRSDEARAHFQAAVDRHTTDPNVIFYLAHLEHAAGVASGQVVPLLERALELNPDLSDAQLELALVATSDGNFDKAVAALKQIRQLRPENAYAAAYTEAYCYAHMDKAAEARAAAHRAQTLAGSDRDRAEVSELFDFIQQESSR